MYTIGQVSAMFNLPVSTLRYYDKEGFFPNLERKGINSLLGFQKEVLAMKKGKNYLKPENQLLKLKFRNFKKLSPS